MPIQKWQVSLSERENSLIEEYIEPVLFPKKVFDISKVRNELGFNPKNPDIAVKEAMIYLKSKEKIMPDGQPHLA